MDDRKDEVFDDLIVTSPAKAVTTVQNKPAAEVKKPEPVNVNKRSLKSRGNPNSTAEATKSVLYRTTPGFYEELAAFAKIKKLSMNTIIETALVNYMGLPENKEAEQRARSVANSLK